MASLISSDVNPVFLPPSVSLVVVNRVFNLVLAKIHQTETLAILSLACLYLVLYKSWLNYRKHITHVEMKRAEGCRPAVGYPHRERILGLDLLWISMKSLQNHTFLETTREILYRGRNSIEYLVLGNTAVITIEPENIKTILSSKFQDFGLGQARKKSLEPLFGDGIFNVDGMMWNHSRAFLRPHVMRQKDGLLNIFESHMQIFINTLPKDGSTFDIQELFSSLMIDIATDVFLGESTNVLKSVSPTSQGRAFAQAFEYASIAVCDRGPLDPYYIWAKIFGDRKLKNSFGTINGFLDRVIQNALQRSKTTNAHNDQEGPRETTFLEDLVKDSQDSQRIKHNILNLLLAGKDTVTALLSNTWFVLAKRPDIYSKLRAEIASLDRKRPSERDLNDLKYLRYVLKECLRLFPPVPLNQRTAEVDTFIPLGGGSDCKSPLFIPKGTSVGYSIYAMHRRRDIFGEDAEEFRPERWENLKPGWAYLPWNGGPRACLGQQYALKKVSYVIVRLVQKFERVESRDPLEWKERLGLTCFSKNGAKVGMFSAKEEL